MDRKVLILLISSFIFIDLSCSMQERDTMKIQYLEFDAVKGYESEDNGLSCYDETGQAVDKKYFLPGDRMKLSVYGDDLDGKSSRCLGRDLTLTYDRYWSTSEPIPVPKKGISSVRAYCLWPGDSSSITSDLSLVEPELHHPILEYTTSDLRTDVLGDFRNMDLCDFRPIVFTPHHLLGKLEFVFYAETDGEEEFSYEVSSVIFRNYPVHGFFDWNTLNDGTDRDYCWRVDHYSEDELRLTVHPPVRVSSSDMSGKLVNDFTVFMMPCILDTGSVSLEINGQECVLPYSLDVHVGKANHVLVHKSAIPSIGH